MNLINKLAGLAAILGVLAIILNFLDRVPLVLAWIYKWGESTAWIIKIGLIMVGGIVWFVTRPRMEDEMEVEAEMEK